MKLKDKVAVVTGATSGIGAETAIIFAREGAKVVLAGRRESEGNKIVDQIKSAGGDAIFVKTDIALESDVKNLIDSAVKKYGKLDIAFNNAGVESMGPLQEFSVEEYQKTFNTNVLGVFLSMKYEIAAMKAGGSIINTSSVAGHRGMSGASVYVASKHAVEGITKTIALEVAGQGIRVNAVSPAAIETDMIDRFAGPEGSETRKQLAAMHPVGRMGKSAEIAHAVVFLASDDSSFVTGTSLIVDGGWLSK